MSPLTNIKRMYKYISIILSGLIAAAYLVGQPTASAARSSLGYILNPSLDARGVLLSNNAAAQPTITIVASNPAAAEAGRETASFTVTRSGDTSEALEVKYGTVGSALADDDYTPLAGSVTIPAGAKSATFMLKPKDDKAVEGAETVLVSLLASDTYQVVAPSSAMATIADDDTATQIVRFYIDDPSAAEVGPDAGRFTIARDGSTAAPLTVFYTVGGTATPGVDYQSLSGTITLPTGLSSAMINVAPIDDRIVEQNEIIVLALSPRSTYGIEAPTSATVTITNNDRTPAPAPSGQRIYLPVVIRGR
jgi:Calx-beta domain-containing protein